MKQLNAISEFLIGLNLFDANDFDSWIDNSRVELSGKELSDGSTEICRHSYTAILYIERFPHKRHAPELLYAQIAKWLLENDNDRFDNKSAEMSIDAEILDTKTAEITIDIDFAETICIQEAVNGSIEFNGKKWQVADADIWVAEESDLVDVRN